VQAGGENKRLKTNVKTVAHSAAKAAQNTPKRCSAVCRNLLICIGWEYYLTNFKTAALSHSATPPHLFSARYEERLRFFCPILLPIFSCFMASTLDLGSVL
jgi:hypothetical protein